MNPVNPFIKENAEKCAWCGQTFTQPYMICVKLPTGFNLKDGIVFLPVEFKKINRIVLAVVMQPLSPGKMQGYDIMFGLCRETCVPSLKSAIEDEANGMAVLN
jgi:hypothetical protein